MTFKHRGEIQVEVGLGLPRMTTAQRVAYTPPSLGYEVYDTDLKVIASYIGGVDLWQLIATQAQVDGKINTVDGVATNTLSVASTEQATPELVMSSGEITIGSSVIAELDVNNPLFASTPSEILFEDNNRTLRYNPSGWDNTLGDITEAFPLISDFTINGDMQVYWETENLYQATSSTRWWGVGVTKSTLHPNNAINFQQSGSTSSQASTFRSTLPGITQNGAGNFNDGIKAPANSIMRHWLDLKTGTYWAAWTWFASGRTELFFYDVPDFDYLPYLYIRGGSGLRARLKAVDQVYSATAPGSVLQADLDLVPAFEGFDDFVALGDALVSDYTTGEIYSPASMTLGIDSSTNLVIDSSNVTASTSVQGLDGTSSSSLVTRSQAGRYQAAFVSGDFVTGDLTITAATHGLPFASGDAYKIKVFEVINDIAYITTLDSGTNATGDVIVSTSGAAFDGIIQISR